MIGSLLRVGLAMLAMLAVGGAASAQSLTEALAEAYRTNPQLLAQRALLRATDELVPQALANWRPTVAFTGQTGYVGAICFLLEHGENRLLVIIL